MKDKINVALCEEPGNSEIVFFVIFRADQQISFADLPSCCYYSRIFKDGARNSQTQIYIPKIYIGKYTVRQERNFPSGKYLMSSFKMPLPRITEQHSHFKICRGEACHDHQMSSSPLLLYTTPPPPNMRYHAYRLQAKMLHPRPRHMQCHSMPYSQKTLPHATPFC